MFLPSYLINPIQKSRYQDALLPTGLHTVCQEAKCPNRGECFSEGIVTFLLLGNRCTRSCRFCAITKGTPDLNFEDNLTYINEVIQMFNLKFVVLTSVTRDDLSDGGASAFVKAIAEIRTYAPTLRIEVLVPDFQGNKAALLG